VSYSYRERHGAPTCLAQPALKHEGRSLRRTDVRHKIFRATDA
jgi:hypothetical protein